MNREQLQQFMDNIDDAWYESCILEYKKERDARLDQLNSFRESTTFKDIKNEILRGLAFSYEDIDYNFDRIISKFEDKSLIKQDFILFLDCLSEDTSWVESEIEEEFSMFPTFVLAGEGLEMTVTHGQGTHIYISKQEGENV